MIGQSGAAPPFPAHRPLRQIAPLDDIVSFAIAKELREGWGGPSAARNVIMPGFYIPVGSGGQIQAPAHTQETARRHRYVLEILEPFGSQADGILLFLSKCQRPSISVDEIAIHSSQDEIFRPGKQHWHPIEFTFYEKVDRYDQPAWMIYQWWADTMIDLRTGLHRPPRQYLKDARLLLLDGMGNKVYEYHIYECWPSKVTPTDLSYADSTIAEISVTLRYAKCAEHRGNSTITSLPESCAV